MSYRTVSMFLKNADVIHCMYITISCSLMNQPDQKVVIGEGENSMNGKLDSLCSIYGQNQQTDKENSLVPKTGCSYSNRK